MTTEAELAECRRLIRSQQALIHTQRARLRQVRNARLAIVAGGYVDDVDPAYEEQKAADLNASAGTYFDEILKTLSFYSEASNYENAMQKPLSPASPILQDQGAKARETLEKLTA